MAVTIIRAGQLIDGTGAEPVAGGVVVIDGERIVYAGAAAGASWGPDATVIEAPGGTVLPGLIDVHVHITYDGGLGRGATLGTPTEEPAALALRGYANALTSLRAGYTTLRDMNAPLYADIALRDAIASGRLPGPRLFTCGQGLCITGGHMDKGTLPMHLTATGRVGVRDTPEGFRQAVREHVRRKVDFIKVNSDVGSVRTPETPYRREMTFEEIRAACDEAHHFGLRVGAHTTGGPPIEDAVRAGVDTVEHGHWLTDRAIDLMIERGAYYVPTLIVNTENFAYTREQLGASEASWGWMRAAYDAKWDSLSRAKAAGVPVAAGSDAGFLVRHGDNAAELEQLVEGGFTPLEAIAAATSTAADLLGLADRIGTLAPGRLADVLVVDGDPLADIALFRRPGAIHHVFRDGARLAGGPAGGPVAGAVDAHPVT